MIDIAGCRDRFTKMLMCAGRSGTGLVLAGLEKLGFFSAPASSKHHLSEPGGLVQHSLNVCDQALAIRKAQVDMNPELASRLPEGSVVVASLLHDVCKAEIYKPETKRRRNESGKWEDYQGYTQDYSHCPMGHGEKSVIRLMRMGFDLTEDEILAIRWHMAGWDMSDSYEARGNFSAACDKSPLLCVLIAADELATRITEVWPRDTQDAPADEACR